MHQPISRRTMLKGLGTAIALPWLDAMAPAWAAPASKPPVRMAFIYIPNGAHMPAWTPEQVGADWKLPPTLEPLAPVRSHLTVLSGLTLDKARPNGDGPGDHARAQASFLTGCQARKTAGADIRVGISVDQVAAHRRGDQTRFPSLELGCEAGRPSGNCDSGYSCAYQYNFAWRSPTTPVPKEIDPRIVFERLFGTGGKEAASARTRRERYRQSVLDLVQEDANSLRRQLGQNDLAKLDEYLTAVREMEKHIELARKRNLEVPKPPTGFAKPTGVPHDYKEHIRLMAELMTLAFQGDLTRIVTFVFANDGSNRPYKPIGVPEGHHDLSHHGNNPRKQAKLAQINRFHVEQLSYLLQQLHAKHEGGSSLLDSSMIVYGAGIGDGNRHNHDDLPILLAGRGGGTIKANRHLNFPLRKQVPLMNLYLAMLDRFGCPSQMLGDSTGRLPGLS